MDIQHHIIQQDGWHWHAVSSGPEDAPPVYLFHCWTGNWRLWQRTMEQLNGRFRFLAIDHLGFGQSDKPRGDHYGIPQQAERAKMVLDYFGYDQVDVMGHSMGGQIALTFAAQFRKIVKKLVVVDPAVIGSDLHPMVQKMMPLSGLLRRNIGWPYRFIERFAHRVPTIGAHFSAPFFAHPSQQKEAALYWLSQVGADGQLMSSGWATKAIHRWTVEPLLGQITAPTLAIWGMKDHATPLTHCDLLVQRMPYCRSVRIPDVGHFPMVESFETYLTAVDEFLSA